MHQMQCRSEDTVQFWQQHVDQNSRKGKDAHDDGLLQSQGLGANRCSEGVGNILQDGTDKGLVSGTTSNDISEQARGSRSSMRCMPIFPGSCTIEAAWQSGVSEGLTLEPVPQPKAKAAKEPTTTSHWLQRMKQATGQHFAWFVPGRVRGGDATRSCCVHRPAEMKAARALHHRKQDFEGCTARLQTVCEPKALLVSHSAAASACCLRLSGVSFQLLQHAVAGRNRRSARHHQACMSFV